MTAWTIKAFSGEQPRISPNLLPASGAQSASNVRFDDGALTAYRQAEHTFQFTSYPGNYNSIYRHNGVWYGWNGYVTAAPGPVASDRLYIMGDGAPQMIAGGVTYALKVPFPTGALTATLSGSATDPSSVPESRVYVYTWVTGFGEESEPCPASNIVAWQAGMTVTLSGFAATPAGRNITTQRIYRTQTGSTGTDLYFIAERAASTSNFVDTIDDSAFAEVLPSRAYNAPIDTLAGLVAMPNGMMAAFDSATKRDLYFCEPFLPHAWPEAYSLQTDYDIVALGAVGTTLVILTTGQPYMAIGTSPSSMQMIKIESNLPCINPFGVQDMGYSIVYPSHEGLVVASAAGQVELITRMLFNRDAWQRLDPTTLCAGQLSGRYIASYNSLNPDGSPLTGTIIITPDGGQSFLARADAIAQAMFYDVTEGALYYLVGTGEILRFDPPSGQPLNYHWKSRPTTLPDAHNFGCILIDAEQNLSDLEIANIEAIRTAVIAANTTLLASPLHAEIDGDVLNAYELGGDGLAIVPSALAGVAVGVYADGTRIATVTKVGQMVRLPSGFRARRWEIDVSGTSRVEQIAMASTVDELRTVAPG